MLVVDDEEGVRRLVAELLNARGVRGPRRCLTAAPRELHAHPPDLVVLYVQMPSRKLGPDAADAIETRRGFGSATATRPSRTGAHRGRGASSRPNRRGAGSRR